MGLSACLRRNNGRLAIRACELIEWPFETEILSQCLSGICGSEFASPAQFRNNELNKIVESAGNRRRYYVEPVSRMFIKCRHHGVGNFVRCSDDHQMAPAI